MEGVGSRLGRALSRYGPVASAPVFSGPVRKWKRQWVLSRPSNNNNNNGRSSSGNGGNNHNGGGPTPTPLFLFRWTPLPSDGEDSVNHPTKRKFRYTPVVALEEKKKKADVEDETSKMNQSTVSETPSSDDVFEKLNVGDDFVNEIQESSEDQLPSTPKHLDLDLFVKGYDDNSHTSGQTEETPGA